MELHELTLPASPVRLKKREQEIYDDIGGRLVQENLLTHIDGYALADLARDIALAEQLRRNITREGMTHKTEAGYVYPNPKVAMLQAVAGRVARAEKSFGMTPAGRKAVRTSGDASKTNAANAKSRWAKFKKKA